MSMKNGFLTRPGKSNSAMVPGKMEVDHFINFPDVCNRDLQQDFIGHCSRK